MKAVNYLRTSSATNVGADKDSDTRQRGTCTSYAAAHGIEIVAEFYDASVMGKDSLLDRDGFSKLILYCQRFGVSKILFETASRFSRELVVQELGWKELTDAGYDLICCDAPEYFSGSSTDPSRQMIRHYFTIAVRNLVRHKGYSLINILGLAIGMTCCVFLLLYVRYELDYDRYPENADRIYRIVNRQSAQAPLGVRSR